MDDGPIPSWVPTSVRDTAVRFELDQLRGPSQALIKNPKMKKVWQQLAGNSSGALLQRSSTIEVAHVDGVLDELGINIDPVWSIRARAAAALYVVCVRELCDRSFLDRKRITLAIKKYQNAAQVCREAMYCRYAGSDSLIKLRERHPSNDSQLSKSLNVVAEYLDYLAAAYKAEPFSARWGGYGSGKKKSTCPPPSAELDCLLLDNRSDAESLVRAQVSAIISHADRIYSPPLRAPLACIASVGLNKDITAKEIENWRSLMKRPRVSETQPD